MHKKNYNNAKANVIETTSEDTSLTGNDNDNATACNTKAAVKSLYSDCEAPDKCSMIVPVWLFAQESPKDRVLVYAALDSQSDSTFILKSTADKLAITGVPTSLTLSTMGFIGQVVTSHKINGLAI